MPIPPSLAAYCSALRVELLVMHWMRRPLWRR